MDLCCNMSNELMDLIEHGVTAVDYTKVYIENLYDTIPSKFKKYGKIMLHGIGVEMPQHTGAIYEKEKIDWDQINRQIEFCQSPHLAMHCASFHKEWEDGKLTYAAVKERMSNYIQDWKQHLNVDLLIENVPYSQYYEFQGPGTIRECVQPKLIRELVYENQIGMCLDLAHAKVSASGLNLPYREYLMQLPLDQVREIHIVGTAVIDGELRDKHQEMQDEDYKILDWILNAEDGPKLKPACVTLEYGGFGEHFAGRSDKNAILRQLNHLQEILKY